jgi:hypothetical protein
MKLTTHLQLVAKFKKMWICTSTPMYALTLNEIGTGTISAFFIFLTVPCCWCLYSCFSLNLLQAAQGAVRLEGDVITANGSIISGQLGGVDSNSLDDGASVCSCSCSCYQGLAEQARHRYTVRRSPGKISHLLPLQPLGLQQGTKENMCKEVHSHRASIWQLLNAGVANGQLVTSSGTPFCEVVFSCSLT